MSNAQPPRFWLIKVPAYVYEDWESKLDGDIQEVGAVEIHPPKMKGRKEEMVLQLNSAEEGAPLSMPIIQQQTPFPMLFFSESTTEADMIRTFIPNGQIDKTVNAQPPSSDKSYREFINRKMERLEPVRNVLHMETDEVIDPAHNQNKTAIRKALKKEEKQNKEKRFRSDDTEVVAMLRRAFATKTHYSLTELTDITKQPKQHLTEILGTYCIKHTSGEFINKYSLKDFNFVTRR